MLVAETPKGDDELSGGFVGKAVCALTEDLTVHVMVGAIDFAVRLSNESEPGEGLTGGGDGERCCAHGVRCFDSLNIHDFGGSDKMVCHLGNWSPDRVAALKKPP